MAIRTGDGLPPATLRLVTDSGATKIDAGRYFQGRHATLFAVPGAFTPRCSEPHLPDYIAQAADFQARSIALSCVAVNDPFVLRAWGKQVGTEGKITLLSDGSGEFAKALGLDIALSAHGLGIRAKRFALVLEEGRGGRGRPRPPRPFCLSECGPAHDHTSVGPREADTLQLGLLILEPGLQHYRLRLTVRLPIGR